MSEGSEKATLSDIYERYQIGAGVTDSGLVDLIAAIEAALPFLSASPAFELVYNEAVADLEVLRGYQAARDTSNAYAEVRPVPRRSTARARQFLVETPFGTMPAKEMVVWHTGLPPERLGPPCCNHPPEKRTSLCGALARGSVPVEWCRHCGAVRFRLARLDRAEDQNDGWAEPEWARAAEGRRAPVKGEHWSGGDHQQPPGSISWDEHMVAWSVYVGTHNDAQSPEQVAARGGFGYSELVSLLGYTPTSWRPE